MARRFGTENVLITNTTVTSISGALDTIIPAQSGWIIGINQIIASNQLNEARSIIFYDGLSRITPNMTLGSSGTVIIDEFGGDQLELSKGSGLFANNNSTSSNIQVTVYYVLHDERTPITKSAARTATYTPIVTRAPKGRNF